MQTLIPQPATATFRPIGRTGKLLGFGLLPRALLLFCVGFLLAIPAFWHGRLIGFMFAWDALLAVFILIELLSLPRPPNLEVTRTFLDSPQLGVATRIELAIRAEHDRLLQLQVTDDLHPSLVAEPKPIPVEAFPREPVTHISTVYPRQRGEFILGRVYLRFRGGLGLVERWAAAEPVSADLPRGAGDKPANAPRGQIVHIYPAHEDSRGSSEFFLLRARQIELQRRKLRLRGQGREFDSLRDYQPGDELRAVSWTASARRGHIVTRQFTAERSQQVWMVLDSGRLSRTAFELRRDERVLKGETEAEREAAHQLTVTQLDQATTAAVMLAQVIGHSGDKFAMLSYGREVRQVLPPGAGAGHLRLLIDLLSSTRSEPAEADPLAAVARLKLLQRRRGLMVWITELADTAGRPELVTAAAELARRHLVVLVLLHHPELEALASRRPENAEEMFHSAAAVEMLERRRSTIAQLEHQGVLIVETTAEEIGIQAVSKYLEVKAQGLL